MPRPRNPDGREPKSRSRSGCWSCKARKIKCTMERPSCAKCIKGDYECEYGIRLNWDGRRSKRPQLKAVHLRSALSGDTGNNNSSEAVVGRPGGDDGFAGPEHGPGSARTASSSTTASSTTASSTHQSALPHPQLEMQFQFDLTAPATATDPLLASSFPSGPAQHTLTFAPIQTPYTGPPRPVSHAGRKNPPHANGDDPSRIYAPSGVPAKASSVLDVSQLEVRPSQTVPRRPTAATGSAFVSVNATRANTSSTAGRYRTPLPDPTSTTDVASAGAGPLSSADSLPPFQPHVADPRRHVLKRPRVALEDDEQDHERDFAWTWPMSPSAGSSSLSGSLSLPSPRQRLMSLPTSSSSSSVRLAVIDTSPRPSGSDSGRGLGSPSAGLAHLQTHRLSVCSLLSGSSDPQSATGTPPSPASPPAPTSAPQPTITDRDRASNYYGVDAGFSDLDLGKNDDASALSGTRRGSVVGRDPASKPCLAFKKGRYYSRPVEVRIPRALGALPRKLTDNPMNLLYFHHFINNTASVLVPHDDPQSNPFRTILPHMALRNDHLLSLLLAYSASHRARILDQSEPQTRIALWVQDIFPALRKALDHDKEKISNANVATAIMLASLAIVSPSAFGYNIPWQQHLMLARQLIAARPGGLRAEPGSSIDAQVCTFLWSWFAYLDVLGGLSAGPKDASPAWILDYKVYDPQDDDEIDCIMGFTTRCVYILSQIAELVRLYEPERLQWWRRQQERRRRRHGGGGDYIKGEDDYGDGDDGNDGDDFWRPSLQVEMRVESLEVDVRDSMRQTPRPCGHLQRTGDAARWDHDEVAATNEAYHWAALVHLQRRVLGRPATHAYVRELVQNVVRCVDRVRVGGLAENCLLFPLFTAGVECQDTAQRQDLLRRAQSVEGSGMMQATGARALMEKAWTTGQPWETLMTTEFIG